MIFFGMIGTLSVRMIGLMPDYIVKAYHTSWKKRSLLTLDRIVVAGIQDPMSSCDPNATRDVNRALSLLSTNPWGAHETKSLSLDHSTRTTGITQSITQAMSQRLSLPSSDYWNTDQPQQPHPSTMCISFSDCDSSNRFQDLQLLSTTPYESGFPCNQLD